MTGRGAAGGFVLQSRAIAYVGTHILSRRPLAWTRHAKADVPSAAAAETGSAGDDMRVELSDSGRVYDCQIKRGLAADNRLDETISGFATGLPDNPDILGLLIVDATS